MSLGSRLSWYRHRLQAMSLSEVCHRLGEHWRLWTQGGFLEDLAPLEHTGVNPRVPRLPDRQTFSATLRTQLAADAKRLRAGEWQIFGWKEVAVGAPPCWHRDPACGVIIDPAKPAHLLNHRQLPDGADARTLWEINRWAEVTRLAMHGWVNQDLDALRTAQLWLEDWSERNPPGLGINWTSPLEVALRLINFTWVDGLIAAALQERPSPLIAEAQSSLVKRVVPVHAAWIWRHRSTGSSANNHLLGELAALVLAGSRWPALETLTDSVEEIWSQLSHEVLHQFAADGGSKEQALHYHLFAFDLAWQAVRAVGCRAGEAHDRLAAAAQFFVDLSAEEECWDFGDNDDAQVLPVTARRDQAVREWRAWFSGEAGMLQQWLGPAPTLLPRPTLGADSWVHYPESGVAGLRHGGWFLRLDASVLGFGRLAAHGHCDALHLSVWDRGQALIIDPGTGGYYGHLSFRTELAAWAAHNGPRPSPIDFRTPRRLGPFLQGQHHATPQLQVADRLATAQLDHEGCAFQRRVHLVGGEVEIHDEEARHRPFQTAWHFAPECVVESLPQAAGLAFLIRRGDHLWELVFDSAHASATLGTVRVSPAYGAVAEAPVIQVQSAGSGMITRLRRCGDRGSQPSR